MIILGIIAAVVAALFSSCTRTSTIEGVVHEVTENTITVTTDGDTKVTFSTRGTKMSCPVGIRRGSPVVVGYSDDISDGFGNARTIKAPETYNLLIGRWEAPCKEMPELKHGFELMEDGSIVEIGDHSIIYCYWKSFDNTLVLSECDDLEEDFEFCQYWRIESLNQSTLTISRCGQTETFARVNSR